mgnify:CR=1 FL=1|tara:strand:- start:109 stop:327 length:219 start_codon:yes stop_codon:yes gene_type:complete
MIYSTGMKCADAINKIKSSAQFVIRGNVNSKSDFEKIEWVTGADENKDAITTITNPHSELTWTKVKAEMDKL